MSSFPPWTSPVPSWEGCTIRMWAPAWISQSGISWCWCRLLWRTTRSPPSLWLCRQPQSSVQVPTYVPTPATITFGSVTPIVRTTSHHPLGPASLQHATSSPTSATSSEDCVAECEASVSGDHKTTKGDVAGSAQLHPLEGQGHCLGLDGCSRLEQTPAPRWADTEKDKVLEPTLSQKPPIYLGVGTNGWDPEAALSCQISVPGWMEGQTGLYLQRWPVFLPH